MNIVDDKKRRRHILKVLGSSAILAPFLSISACSGEKNPPPDAAPDNFTPSNAADPAPTSEPASIPESSPPPAETPVERAATDSAMPRLSEDDPQASALSYVEDATRLDNARFPSYEAGQMCANCALFLGEEGSSLGTCSIFPGKLVNAAAWCSVYAPKG